MASQVQGGASPVDVAEFIDRQPVGGFQIRLLLTCAAVLFLDGFDTQAIGMSRLRLPRNGT
jgi:MFS transporter, AAHS family, 4-hydroxybenzoate transporter